MVAFWCLVALFSLPCLVATIVVGARFRPRPPSAQVPSGLSVIVPIKGIDADTESNLEALLASDVPVPVEYLIAMESTDDPAHDVALRVQAGHPEVASSIVVTESAGARMGKQHNLATAAAGARYDTIASMDVDVRVDEDTLALGLTYLAGPGVGVAYFLPRYAGPGRAGGRLVALYSNYYYQLNMGSLALSRSAPFITGALWFMSGEARRRIGGLEQFTSTISDDAAIGRAVVAAGLRTLLIPRAVRIPYEDLDLRGGARHVLKWLTLLRAEGVATYSSIALTWHPLLLTTVAAIVAAANGVPAVAAASAVAAVLALRFASALVLHARAYGQRDLSSLLWLPAYELIAAPALYARGLFARHVTWRGTRYRIGRGGTILSAEPARPR